MSINVKQLKSGLVGQHPTTNSTNGVVWSDKDPTDVVYTYDGSDRVATQTITDDIGTIVTTYTYKVDDRIDFYTVNKYGNTKTYTPTYTPVDSNKITQIVIT